MLLTPEQLYEIQKIITEHHSAFMANTIGPEVIPPEVLKILKAKGLIKESLNTIGEAYTYGQLLGTLESKNIAKMSYADFKNHVKNNPVPLTEIERGAMAMAAQNAAQYCRGLGNRVDLATGAILIEADRKLRARIEEDIRDATEENIAKRETVQQLQSDLGWATQDWARDLKRIAVTEKVTAMNQGTSDHFKKRYGADTLVAKRALPSACSHCQRLHNGPNGPRVFKLSTLEAHGTNVGKKAADWQAVVGASHPNCSCILIRVPKGWGWDEFGDLVPGGKVDLYESPKDLELAMQQEADLQKSFALQGHLVYQGIPIAIENKNGSIRKWSDITGATGQTKMQGVSYGYVQGTVGADGDEIDVFVGPDPRAKLVYVIDQQNPHTGQYDEQKCFLGFPNQHTAEAAYRLHYDNPDNFFLGIQAMELKHFDRWVALTRPQKGELVKSEAPKRGLSLVIPLPDDLEKGQKGVAIGGKYIKRVPYTTKEGKQRFRYFYTESASARDVKTGETVKLGQQYATVQSIDTDGAVHLAVGDTNIKVAANQWDNLLSTHYGNAYFDWAEKRASQSVNAVTRHVPVAELVDLKGTTDEERLKDLQTRVPKVYDKLQKSFDRAGVNPHRAKQVLSSSLERRGWEPDARAAVIGNVITKRNGDYQTTIRAAENLAGGGHVKLGHVAAVTHIVEQAKNPEKDEIGEIAARAEKELTKLSELLIKAREGNDKDKAEALATALSSHAIQQLNVLAKAFPGLADKAVEPARQIMLEVPSLAPNAAPKAIGSTTTVYVAGEGGQPKALNAKFKLVEADKAIASHDPRSFNKRADYPEGIQERAYHRDQAEQAKVIRNAQKLLPAMVVNTNPDSVNGAPIMGPDGVVLGGNSRTMSMQLAYARHPEKAKELKDYLREHAHEAGFTKEDVDQFKNPILVREVEDGGKTKEDRQLLVRQMNESFTQSMDPRTMQVAMGRKITDETLTALGNAMEPDETLNEFLLTNRAAPFINALQKAGIIDQRNSNQYFVKGTKKLNPDGTTLVARVLVGRTIGDADLLSATKAIIVENLASATPYLAQAKVYGDGFDLTKDLNTALDAYNGLQYRVDTKAIPALNKDMSEERFKGLFNQQEMFGGEHPIVGNSKAMGLLEMLIRRPGPVQLGKFFKDFAEQAKSNPENQESMFGSKKTPTSIIKELVEKHAKISAGEAQAKGEAKAKKKRGRKSKAEKLEEEKRAQEQAKPEPKPEPEPEPERTPEPVQEGPGLFASMEPAGKVVRQPVTKLDKSWGYFVGPHGGKWADPNHTIPWKEPVKETGRRELGPRGPDTTDVPPLPGQIDIYEYAYKIKKEREEKEKAKESKKSLSAEMVAANSPAGGRAPGPGLGINFLTPVPVKKGNKGKKAYLVGKEELTDPLTMENEVGALHVDKDTYDFTSPQRIVRPYDLPEDFTEAHADAREGTEERMDWLSNEPIRNARRPKNKVEIE